MEPIAIVGMACRFPGAPSLSAFWHLLSEGAHGIGPVPAERWDADSLYSPDAKAPGKTSSRLGGFIGDIDKFDAAAFGISPREAVQMDPQQRVLLELAHEAFEDAGLATTAISGSDTAVYIGAMSNDYLRHQTADDYRLIDVHTGGGAGFSMLANRLSYQFNLHGPSMAIDSACSSSLVTVFQACQAIWTGQSGLALAGGVNLMLDPAFNVFYAKGGLLAPDGRCKTFSAKADGIGRGEGAGLVVLKKESAALRDGDTIYAVIRGGAVNHGGRSNGVTAPNRWSQEKLLRNAFRHAGVTGDQLHYVELHGTGTYIGDPIEANALGTVMKEDGRSAPCLVGSVKSNIGHLEGAAGVAGLIKLALSLHHRTLIASLGFDEPNPAIDFSALQLAVNTHRQAWPQSDREAGPLLAGISSFGLGGTNAHLVLASASDQHASQVEAQSALPAHMLLLSAHNEAALLEHALQMRQWLAQAHIDVASVCMTALRRRSVHDQRLHLLGHDRESLLQALDDHLAARASDRVLTGRFKARRLAIAIQVPHADTLRAGPLAQWLMQAPLGREAWNSCRELLMVEGDERLPSLAQLMDATPPSDPSTLALWCFAGQYAMLQQLLGTLAGTSSIAAGGSGQLAACCASGALTLSQALDWLRAGLGSPAPVTEAYRVPCECAGVLNPALSSIDWQAAPAAALPAPSGKAAALTVVVNLDGRPASAESDHACFSLDEHDFGRLFARLGFMCPLDWAALADARFVRLPSYPWQREAYWLPRPAAARPPSVNATPEGEAPASLSESPLRAGMRQADAAQRLLMLRDYLRECVAASLRMPQDALDTAQPLNTIGIDSLTAVEIKNKVERDLRVTLPVVKFLDGHAIDDFAAMLANQLDGSGAVLPAPVVAAPQLVLDAAADLIEEQVAAMSPDQVNDLLAQLMQEVS